MYQVSHPIYTLGFPWVELIQFIEKKENKN